MGVERWKWVLTNSFIPEIQSFVKKNLLKDNPICLITGAVPLPPNECESKSIQERLLDWLESASWPTVDSSYFCMYEVVVPSVIRLIDITSPSISEVLRIETKSINNHIIHGVISTSIIVSFDLIAHNRLNFSYLCFQLDIIWLPSWEQCFLLLKEDNVTCFVDNNVIEKLNECCQL